MPAGERHHITTGESRIEGGAVKGEERNLIDFRPENSERGGLAGKGKAAIAGRELSLIEKEIIFG